MGWMTREHAMERFWRRPNWKVDVESSEMREELGLRFYLESGKSISPRKSREGA